MNLVLVLFGGDYKRIPISFSASSFQVGNYYIAMPQAYAFLAAMGVMAFLHWLLNYTVIGKAIRAVSEDRSTAQLMGINVDKMYALTFGLGIALTGTSAAFLSTLYPVFPTVGSYFILIAFVVVVLGGLGSAPGALVGGLFIGVAESLSGYYVGQGWKQAVYFMLFILILIVRPNGIFGRTQVR
jgi:branched-chain amino acid transport system permease protein